MCIRDSILDLQFLGDLCWTVTPLCSNDFLKVPEFEFLNLNYQTNFKKTILTSICQDDIIFGYHPSGIYQSNKFGIGALTTLIPVPLARLEWGSTRSYFNDDIQLQFTAFDPNGELTIADRNPQGDVTELRNPINNEAPSHNTIKIRTVPEPLYHYYISDGGEKVCPSNTEEKRYQKWWNSKLNMNDHITTTSVTTSAAKSSYKFMIEEDTKGFESSMQETNRTSHLLEPVSKQLASGILKELLLESDTEDMSFWAKLGGLTMQEAQDDDITPFINSPIDKEDYLNGSAGSDDYDSDDSSYRISLLGETGWWLHNHVRKIRSLLSHITPESEASPKGYQLCDLNNDFLFVTTVRNVYLLKANPLIVTSFGQDDMFPVHRMDLCSEHELIDSLNRINFVCHIRELNCIVVASQLGLVSLLRLTEYKGIFSFRQEYILGWKCQDPNLSYPDHQCIRGSFQAVSYTHLDVYKRQVFGS